MGLPNANILGGDIVRQATSYLRLVLHIGVSSHNLTNLVSGRAKKGESYEHICKIDVYLVPVAKQRFFGELIRMFIKVICIES